MTIRPEQLMSEPKVYTVRERSTTSSPTPQPKGTRVSVKFRDNDSFNRVCQAIAHGNSVIVLGEAGTGKGEFAVALHEEMSNEYQSAIATYKGMSLRKAKCLMSKRFHFS